MTDLAVAQIAAYHILSGILFPLRICIVKPHPAKQRIDPGGKDQRLKGLHQIIIASQRQAIVKIHICIPCRQQDHRHLRSPADLLQDTDPVRTRHHDIQDHQIAGSLLKHVKEQIPRLEGLHFMPFITQKRANDFPDIFFIIRIINLSHRLLPHNP